MARVRCFGIADHASTQSGTMKIGCAPCKECSLPHSVSFEDRDIAVLHSNATLYANIDIIDSLASDIASRLQIKNKLNMLHTRNVQCLVVVPSGV